MFGAKDAPESPPPPVVAVVFTVLTLLAAGDVFSGAVSAAKDAPQSPAYSIACVNSRFGVVGS